jgi:hypothetical protein
MSREPAGPWYLTQSNYREWAVNAAFGPLDAGLAWFLLHERSRSFRRRSRSALSSASARYVVQPRNSDVRAWIDLRMVDTNLTLILLDSYPVGSPASGSPEQLEAQDRWHEQMGMLVDEFIAWFDQDRARVAALAGATPAAHPLDRVLAEYEHRRAAGETLSLKEIADERGVSYDSLRKRRSHNLGTNRHSKIDQKA